MKVILLFSALITIALCKDVVIPCIKVNTYIKLSDACAKCSNIDGKYFFYKLFEGKLLDIEIWRKHLVCLYKKFGILHRSGKINPRGFQELMDFAGERNSKAIVSKCLKQKSSVEQTAWNVYNCFIKNKNIVLKQGCDPCKK